MARNSECVESLKVEVLEDVSRPRTTGSLRWSMVKNLPFGYARAMIILKELVPMSIAANRDEGVGGVGTVEAMGTVASWAFCDPGYAQVLSTICIYSTCNLFAYCLVPR